MMCKLVPSSTKNVTWLPICQLHSREKSPLNEILVLYSEKCSLKDTDVIVLLSKIL